MFQLQNSGVSIARLYNHSEYCTAGSFTSPLVTCALSSFYFARDTPAASATTTALLTSLRRYTVVHLTMYSNNSEDEHVHRTPESLLYMCNSPVLKWLHAGRFSRPACHGGCSFEVAGRWCRDRMDLTQLAAVHIQ